MINSRRHRGCNRVPPTGGTDEELDLANRKQKVGDLQVGGREQGNGRDGWLVAEKREGSRVSLWGWRGGSVGGCVVVKRGRTPSITSGVGGAEGGVGGVSGTPETTDQRRLVARSPLAVSATHRYAVPTALVT